MAPDTQGGVELNRADQPALFLPQASLPPNPAQSSSHGLEGLQGLGAAQCTHSTPLPQTCNFSGFRFLYPPGGCSPKAWRGGKELML